MPDTYDGQRLVRLADGRYAIPELGEAFSGLTEAAVTSIYSEQGWGDPSGSSVWGGEVSAPEEITGAPQLTPDPNAPEPMGPDPDWTPPADDLNAEQEFYAREGFNTDAYVDANPFLKQLYESGDPYYADGSEFDPYQHYQDYGEAEGRSLGAIWGERPGGGREFSQADYEHILAGGGQDSNSNDMIDADEWTQWMLDKGAGMVGAGEADDAQYMEGYINKLRGATDSGELSQQMELDTLNRINAQGIDPNTNPYGQEMGLQGTQMASHYVAQQGQDRGYFKPQEAYDKGSYGGLRTEAAPWDTSPLVDRSNPISPVTDQDIANAGNGGGQFPAGADPALTTPNSTVITGGAIPLTQDSVIHPETGLKVAKSTLTAAQLAATR